MFFYQIVAYSSLFLDEAVHIKHMLPDSLNKRLRDMALTPRKQLKRLLVGTIVSMFGIIALIYVSKTENQWLFTSVSVIVIASVLYAIPGYIGIWMWRMRKVFFDLD
ncbi:MAG: hypothetical protein OQJ89_03165 [Kangiellaceae bacterium]|nr:hypothetical protein [Kangiellaceae bacterium]MCW8999663.1 hypothetical protein [Kangiellaceae bacterium]MCW9015936.1 hypothetical protein [Kangiellaceae bacterium]